MHTNAFLTTTNTNTTITLQHAKGWRFCSHITLDVTAPLWVPARTPTVHGGPYAGRPWVARRQATTRDDQTTTSLKTNVRINNQVLTDTWNLTWLRSSATITWQTSRTRRQQGRRGVPDHQEDRAEKRNPPLRRRSTRRPNTPSRTRPSTSRFRRISALTKLLMCQLQNSERFLRFARRTERVGQGDPTSGFELDLRYSERAC